MILQMGVKNANRLPFSLNKIKGFERFAYYCYSNYMVSKEAKRRYKIILFYKKYGLDATLEAFEISKRVL